MNSSSGSEKALPLGGLLRIRSEGSSLARIRTEWAAPDRVLCEKIEARTNAGESSICESYGVYETVQVQSVLRHDRTRYGKLSKRLQ